MKRQKKAMEFEESSGNVFADLGVARPDEALAKSWVALEIGRVIKHKRLTQVQVAKLLGIGQSKVSLLLRGYLTNFSLERLFRFLNDLGQDVVISILPSKKKSRHGSTRIGNATASRIAALSK